MFVFFLVVCVVMLVRYEAKHKKGGKAKFLARNKFLKEMSDDLMHNPAYCDALGNVNNHD